MSENRIIVAASASARLRHAAADLQRYLAQATGTFLPIANDATFAEPGARFVLGVLGDGGPGDRIAARAGLRPQGPEGYHLHRFDDDAGPVVAILGGGEAGAVYGAYALLEAAYGCGFFLGSEVVPPGTIPLLPAALDLRRAPSFATRGLLPWYDFLSGPSAWNLADYRLIVDRMVRMGLNFLGFHVYSKGPVTRSQGAEPFLSFTYHGIGHDAVLDTTQTNRWGYLPKRISDFAYGTDRFFAGEVFGADAAVLAAGPLDAAARAKALLRDALTYAKERGLRVCVGFEPAAIPDEIVDALPTGARRRIQTPLGSDDALDLDSVAAREILHLRLDDLLATYPMVDAVWLWQNEDAAWTVRHEGDEVLPFDASYLRLAYDYLKERAPRVQLVVSGWGAVHQHFGDLHAALPDDIAFSALNHYLGSSQTDDVYGRLGARSRWPIPWLEDDATLWHPQYHLHRFHNDVLRAHRFGCDGMIGIHWRTRVIDHNAAYFARSLWEPDLDPADYYRDYATRLAGADAGRLWAEALDETDRSHRWPGWFDEDSVAIPGWDHGHSNEATDCFNPLPIPDDLVRGFAAFAARLDEALAMTADAPAAERLAYHRAQVAFVQDYVRSQQAARAIDDLVARAVAERRRLSAAETDGARARLSDLYAAVRGAVEGFASVMTTTADLGVLASLNQKYVTRACWHRYDTLCEHTAEAEQLPRPDLTAAAEAAPRVFVPVPPEALDDGGAVVEAIAADPTVAAVSLHWSPLAGGTEQTAALMRKAGGVWTGMLRSDVPVRYWLTALDGMGRESARWPVAPATASAIRIDRPSGL
ncbi:MAG TPA: hypothetical protein VH482_34775 [Thermomicrobiales bacterium]